MHKTAGSLYFIQEQATLVAVDYALPTAYEKVRFDFKNEYYILASIIKTSWSCIHTHTH